MSAVSPAATFLEPIVGWRCWRVLALDRLDGKRSYRLAAVGTLGVPKFWTPGQAVVAACSKYASEHESPWLACECGIWALDRPAAARRRMVQFMQTQGGKPAGWAFGQVSLWGRVVEHENGWRGQCAYPYAITVESTDESVARVIRDAYAIDVEWAGGELYEKAIAKRRERDKAARREQEARKQKLQEWIDGLGARAGTSPREGFKQSMWYRMSYVEEDELLQSLANAVAGTDPRQAVTSRDVTRQLARDQGHDEQEESDRYVFGIARKLKLAAVAGRATQWRRSGAGTSRWSFTDDDLEMVGWESCGNPHEAFDAATLADFKATLRSMKVQSARVRDIVAHLGRPNASTGEKVRLAHALNRLALRGVVSAQRTRPIESWTLV